MNVLHMCMLCVYIVSVYVVSVCVLCACVCCVCDCGRVSLCVCERGGKAVFYIDASQKLCLYSQHSVCLHVCEYMPMDECVLHNGAIQM